MARNPKAPSSRSSITPTDNMPASGESSSAASGNVGIAREMVSSSLAAQQNLVSWMAQWQAINSQAVVNCLEALRDAHREALQAQDLNHLMSLPMGLLQRQCSEYSALVSEAYTRLAQTEAQTIDQVNAELPKLWRRMVPSEVVEAPTPSNEGDTSPLAQIGRAQAEWLALTQRWIDGVKQAQHNTASSSATTR
ncbi:MAG: hypothetical protein ACKOF9_07085 [Burkholderiales bacterium]